MIQKIQNADYQVVFVTPEMILTNALWRKILYSSVLSEHLRAFVVDEAHTIIHW